MPLSLDAQNMCIKRQQIQQAEITQRACVKTEPLRLRFKDSPQKYLQTQATQMRAPTSAVSDKHHYVIIQKEREQFAETKYT